VTRTRDAATMRRRREPPVVHGTGSMRRSSHGSEHRSATERRSEIVWPCIVHTGGFNPAFFSATSWNGRKEMLARQQQQFHKLNIDLKRARKPAWRKF